jgi:hypothetical protein
MRAPVGVVQRQFYPAQRGAGLLLQCVAEFMAMSAKAKNTEHKLPPRSAGKAAETAALKPPKEIGGRDGPEPVRYGDWEKNGRCIDF